MYCCCGHLFLEKGSMFSCGLKPEHNYECETKEGGLTRSWGVSLLYSRSRRWWSSQIPQMCRSLLSPQKPPDDLGKQKHVNNTTCVKHWRWYHCPRRIPLRATLRFGCIFRGKKEMKEEIAFAVIQLRRLNLTSAVRREMWWECIQNGCPCSSSPVPGRIDW